LRSLGLDIGDRRIGVAVSDPLGVLARPLLVLERDEDEAAIRRIGELVSQYRAEVVVAGLPRSLDGSIREQAEKVKAFAEKLKLALNISLEYRDERLTTVAAKDLLESGGKKKKGRVEKGAYDAAAAAIILQDYLNERHPLEYPPE
jgi:putative Holliday junction resolvase